MTDPSNPTVPTEFVGAEFDTTVTENDIQQLTGVLNEIVSDLRSKLNSDDLLEDILRGDEGAQGIKGKHSKTGQDPEPLTQQNIIEPLLREIGYDDWETEVSGRSDEREKVADYGISISERGIDSNYLYIEAEPLNKSLQKDGHGVNQVKSWLKLDEFESNFGYATDGVRWVFTRRDPDSYTNDTIESIDLSDVLLTLFLNQTSGDETPFEALTDEEKQTLRGFYRSFSHDNFLAIARDARAVIRRKQQAITDEFYDEYVKIVFGVRKGGERSQRSLISGISSDGDVPGEKTRLFAVKLANRLIFIKFLEDKGIVEETLLQDLLNNYENSIRAKSFYKELLEPLFFDVMNTHPDRRADEVEKVDLLAEMPYLNGGLFRPHLGEEGGISEKKFDVDDTVLKSIIQLLEKYNFSVDGGPTDLDPSVLGNVFEKTINYLTSDPADQNKELGAYYTPKEITRFSAEQTVQQAVYDRFKPIVADELGWPEETFNRYDTVHSLVSSLPADEDLINELRDELNHFRVVDPAMGSGHFLTSVLEEIVGIREALCTQGSIDTSEFLMKKKTVQNNIYGVDIVGPAVEIGKLRCWLSTIADLTEEEIEEYDLSEFALPNIAFNMRQGNSLIGFTGFPEKTDSGDAYTLEGFTDESVRTRYGDIIKEMDKYEEYGNKGEPETAEKHRSNAFEKLREARSELVPDIHGEFVQAGVDITKDEVADLDPFHWVLEFSRVYADGGFDVVIGNPPWDRIKPNKENFFSRYDDEFRTLTSSEKKTRQEELLNQSHIVDAWEQYNREIDVRAQYFNDGPAYTMQEAEVAGRTEASESDLSSLFFERVFDIADEDGYISQVLPGRIFHGAPTKTLRAHMLNETTVSSLVSFENNGIFDNIDTRYNFGVVTLKNTGSTDVLRGIFQHRDLDILQNTDELIDIPRQVLSDFSPSSMLFPRIQDERDVGVLQACVSHDSIGSSDREWYAHPTRPLDKTADSDRFFDDPEGCDYEILTGRNFYSYCHDPTFIDDLDYPFQWSVDEDRDPDRSAKQRIREKRMRKLKRAVYEICDEDGSMKSVVNEKLQENGNRGTPLSPQDVKLPSSTYRLGFRRVARGTDEQSLISAVVPPGPVCDYSFYVIEPFEINPSEDDFKEETLQSAYESIFSEEELFAALGLLNSLPFDFLIRRKIDNSIPQYSFKETQVPELTAGDEWFEFIWERAAKLNCYGEEFEEIRSEDRLDVDPETNRRQRKVLRAEIDAAAFHAYGVTREQAEFVTEQYHRVESPRIRDDEYFDMVLREYDAIGESD